MEHKAFKNLLSWYNPNVDLPCSNTIKNRLKFLYDPIKAKVDMRLSEMSKDTVSPYAHDAWSDEGMQNSYFGIFAYYVDEDYKYQKALMQVMAVNNKHEGKRIGQALYKLFEEICISAGVGPGTGDNVRDNKAAAIHLSSLLRANHDSNIWSRDMVGCLCHIVNLAAKDFLKMEG